MVLIGPDSSRIQNTLKNRVRGIMGQAPQVRTAVLVPLVEEADGSLSVLFTKRAMTLRRQPGEISFPGGHCEAADSSDKETALRETREELGVLASDITYLGPLDVLVAWSGLIVYPHVGMVPHPNRLKPNPNEVGEVFTVPLTDLLQITPEIHQVGLRVAPPENFPYEKIPNGKNYRWRTTETNQYFYQAGGEIIWGLTARILANFLEVVTCL